MVTHGGPGGVVTHVGPGGAAGGGAAGGIPGLPAGIAQALQSAVNSAITGGGAGERSISFQVICYDNFEHLFSTNNLYRHF